MSDLVLLFFYFQFLLSHLPSTAIGTSLFYYYCYYYYY